MIKRHLRVRGYLFKIKNPGEEAI